MRGFDFYEILGVLVPGSILLLGVFLLYPQVRLSPQDANLAIGGFGVFTLLAYGVGHLLQAIGNALEWLWWLLWGGLPSDWVRTDTHPILSENQRVALGQQISPKLGLPEPVVLSSTTSFAWFGVTRQMYAAIAGAGRSQRIDIFNATYGLSRGIAAALISLSVLTLVEYRSQQIRIAALLAAAAAIAIYRMHRFGKHYARELFVQFLQLPMPLPDQKKAEN